MENIKSSPIRFGLILFGITMLLFFIVYYFFAGENYWVTSVQVNSFVLPALYAGGAFWSVYSLRKEMGRITFPQAFKQSFFTLFVGGVLSLSSIYLFLNYVDTGARDILNYQFVTTQENKLDEARANQLKKAANLKDQTKKDEVQANYENYKKGLKAAKDNKTNYFSFKYLSGLFGVFLLFYLFLSVAFGAFLKNKKRYEE